MMPTIEISSPTFSRLQAYATPLVDSVETALTKVLDLADSVSKSRTKSSIAPPSNSQNAPDLCFATLKSASINGKALPPGQCNWNALMMAVVEQAAAKLPKGSQIVDLIVVNHVAGRKEDNGYKFLKGAGVSIQGQNSNNAWKAIAHIARATGVKVEARFNWSNHPKAAKPGETGRLTV